MALYSTYIIFVFALPKLPSYPAYKSKFDKYLRLKSRVILVRNTVTTESNTVYCEENDNIFTND